MADTDPPFSVLRSLATLGVVLAMLTLGCARPSVVMAQQTLATSAPPMTASDADAIRAQLLPCWNFDATVTNPERYTVVVRISLRADGTIIDAKLADTSRLFDPIYYAVALAALRAVSSPSCQPLHLPQGRFWPQIDIVFNLAEAINGGS
jgi:hypothetical protein